MRMSDKEFQDLYSTLTPDAQRDAQTQLGMWETPQNAPQKPRPQAPKKQKRRHKHIWGWILLAYLLLIAACVLPGLLMGKP